MNWRMMMPEATVTSRRAMTQIALVTGTSSGMGLQTAVGLAVAGVRVVATMRDLSRAGDLQAAAKAAGVTVDVRSLDVTDPQAAARCVDEVLASYGQIDILVNNAGRGAVGSLEQLSMDDLRAQLDVNYLGVAGLTKLVLPPMRLAGRGRIVTVTSVGGAVGQPFADAYCGAKFAVEGLMQSLAPVVARFGIDVCVVEPGPVASEFVANLAMVGAAEDEPGSAEVDASAPYAEMQRAYLARSRGVFTGAQTTDAAAAVIIEAATSDNPRFRWQTSAAASAFVGLSLADVDGSRVLAQTSTWINPG
jgi:NAD(P)-dependent dehydrogenase (short-subunit alcohol dehydrogenase family)